MQDIIATAFEAAGVPHVDPSSLRSQPPLTRRNGEAGRRAALAGRLFRLLSPAALRLVHDMGMATTVATNGPNACTCLCVCMCHGHTPCLRRLLRHPACDVGAACCELPPPAFVLLFAIAAMTSFVGVHAEPSCLRTNAVLVVRPSPSES